MPSKDKEANREAQRKFYRLNKTKCVTKNKLRQAKIDLWYKEYKSKLICEKCSENHPATLQFHHINPAEKEINLSRASRQGWGIKRIKKEISKCVVLCANCHAKLHYEEKTLL